MNVKRRQTTLLAIGYTCLTLSLCYLASIKPADGYEYSIYSSLSPQFWLILLIAAICGVLSVLYTLFSHSSLLKWGLGFGLIAITSCVVLLLPLARGYSFYGMGDSLTHLTEVTKILDLGHFDRNNFYPLAHLFVSETSSVSGLQAAYVMLVLPPFLTAFYFLSLFCLARKAFPDVKVQIIASLLTPILVIGYFGPFTPNGFAALLLPFILYVFVCAVKGTGDLQFAIPLIVFLVAIPLIHILVAAFLLGIFVLMLVWKRLAQKRLAQRIEINNSSLINYSLIICVSLLTWMSFFALFQNSIMGFYRFIMGELSISPVISAGSILSSLPMGLMEKVTLIFNMFGSTIILLLLGILGMITYFKKFKVVGKDYFFPVSIALSTGIISAAWSVIPSGIDIFRPLRLWGTALVLLGSVSIYLLVVNRRRIGTRLKACVILTLVTIPMMLGFFSANASPALLMPNEQLTFAELSGAKMLVIQQNDSLVIGSVTNKDRLLAYAVEVEESSTSVASTYVGDHFTEINETKYCLFSQYDTDLYLRTWHVGRFTPQDFAEIREEVPILWYSNGESTIVSIV